MIRRKTCPFSDLMIRVRLKFSEFAMGLMGISLVIGSAGAAEAVVPEEPQKTALSFTPVVVADPGQGLPVALGETPPAPDESQPQASRPARGEWVIAPIPFVNPLVGYGLAGGVGYIYHPKDSDPKLAPWVSGLGGFFSENNSWALGLGQKMNLDHDTWRLSGLAGYGVVNYDFYGIGIAAAQNKLASLKQTVTGLTLEGLYRVHDHLYAGLGFALSGVNTQVTSTSLPPWINDIISNHQLAATLSIPSLRMQWDTRDNTFYPTQGWLVDGEASFSDQSLGSTFTYQAVKVVIRHYWRLSDTQTLAVYGFGRRAYGDVPFYALSMIGANGNLRGYTTGRYQDYLAVTGQVEYRWQAWHRLGLVAFAGVGAVAPDLSGLAHSEALPSVGGGLRYLIAEQNKLNFRLDVAWGRDDALVYVSVGEAF